MSLAITPSVMEAQDDAAARRTPVRMDSARTALLYVSNRAADLPKSDYERQLAQKRRTDSAPRLTRHTSTTLIEFPVPKDGRYLMLKGAPPVRLETLNVMTNFPALMEEKLRA